MAVPEPVNHNNLLKISNLESVETECVVIGREMSSKTHWSLHHSGDVTNRKIVLMLRQIKCASFAV